MFSPRSFGPFKLTLGTISFGFFMASSASRVNKALQALEASVRPGCKLIVKENIPGQPGASLEDVSQDLLDMFVSLSPSCFGLFLKACTGSGKTKIFPTIAISKLFELRKLQLKSRDVAVQNCKVLLVTPVKMDAPDIAASCSWPSFWKTGDSEHGVGDKSKALLHVVNVETFAKWLGNREQIIGDYGAVLFDEFDEGTRSPVYATLVWRAIKSMAHPTKSQSFTRLVFMSATPPPVFVEKFLSEGSAKEFVYNLRQHQLVKYDLEIDSEHCPCEMIVDLSKALLRQGYSSLVFLPGEAEINTGVGAVPQEDIKPLHSKLGKEEQTAALTPSVDGRPRVVLSSSAAEKGVTIPDMTFSLDSSVGRMESTNLGVSRFDDVAVDAAQADQRAGRVARVGFGISVRIIHRKRLPSMIPATGQVMDAVVLDMPQELARKGDQTFMCSVDTCLEAEARAMLRELFRGPAAARAAYQEIPLELKWAGVLGKAQEAGAWDVRLEVAWIASLLDAGAVKAKSITVASVLEALWKPHSEVKSGFHKDKFRRAWEATKNVKQRLGLRYCTMEQACIVDAITVAFSYLPGAVCWRKDNVAHYIGEPFGSLGPDGYVVCIGFRDKKWGQGWAPLLELPMSTWAAKCTQQTLPTGTAVGSTDSTFENFQLDVFLALRRRGYDLTGWRAAGGAWEQQVLSALDMIKVADLALVAPNGNRIEKQVGDTSIPLWIQSTAASSASLLSRFGRAAVFVGHAGLSPGVRAPDIYAKLSSIFCSELENSGVAVVRGEEHHPQLLTDGVHWDASSGRAVQGIIGDMVEKSRKVTVSGGDVEPPKWWHWARDSTNGIHYATCKACVKRLTADHVVSSKHRLLCDFTNLPVVLERVWPPCTPDTVEQGSEPQPPAPSAAPPPPPPQEEPASPPPPPQEEQAPPPPPPQEEPTPPPPPPPPMTQSPPQEVSRHEVRHAWCPPANAAFTPEYMPVVAGETFVFIGEFDQGWAKGFSPRLARYGWVPGNHLTPEIPAPA